MKKVLVIFLTVFIIFVSCGCEKADFLNTASKISQALDNVIVEIKENQVKDIELHPYTAFPPKNNSCYKKLNDTQKEIYKTIYAISEQMPKGFINLGEATQNVESDIAIAYSAFLNDCVEVFWMPNKYIIGRYKNNFKEQMSIAFSSSNSDKQLDYIVSKDKRNVMKDLLEDFVNDVVNKAQNLSSVYEKEKFFNDRICSRTEYKKNGKLSHTAYGALIDGSALCEGYSRAFKLLCNKAGIECELISGKADGEGHMWNTVCIDGNYSFVDTTWNDSGDEFSYLYFNVTESQLSVTHKMSPLLSTVSAKEVKSDTAFNFFKPVCDNTENTYFAKNGFVLGDTYIKQAVKVIENEFSAGRENVVFLIQNKAFINAIENDDISYINDIQKNLKNVRIESYSFVRDVLSLKITSKYLD